MAKAINMPQVGQDLETALIVEWRVKEGDKVKKGDVVALVESDKATFEVEVFEDGTVVSILFKEGEEAKVFAPIAYLGEAKEEPPTAKATPAAPTSPATIVRPDAPSSAHAIAGEKVFSTPSARRLAKEHSIELKNVTGTGPNGRILKQDILAAISTATLQPAKEAPRQIVPQIEPIVPPSAEPEDRIVPFTKIRQRIAERLLQSKQTIPHFYLFMDMDVTAALAWRNAFNTSSDVKITVNDLIVKAVALALRKHPNINAHVEQDRLIIRKDINIGVAVSVEQGLLVPVIAKADQKALLSISKEIREATEGAKRGVLKAQAAGTFTVSNLGMYSIDAFLPIINPPECAILGVGQAQKRLVSMENNTIGIRDMLTLSLACDHRAVDGTYAAQFLDSIRGFLNSLNL